MTDKPPFAIIDFDEWLEHELRDPAFAFRWYISTPYWWLIHVWYEIPTTENISENYEAMRDVLSFWDNPIDAEYDE